MYICCTKRRTKILGLIILYYQQQPSKNKDKKSFMAALHNVFPTVLYRMVGIGIAQAQKARKVIITKITRQLSRGNIFIFYSWKKSSTKISKSLITRGTACEEVISWYFLSALLFFTQYVWHIFSKSKVDVGIYNALLFGWCTISCRFILCCYLALSKEFTSQLSTVRVIFRSV